METVIFVFFMSFKSSDTFRMAVDLSTNNVLFLNLLLAVHYSDGYFITYCSKQGLNQVFATLHKMQFNARILRTLVINKFRINDKMIFSYNLIVFYDLSFFYITWSTFFLETFILSFIFKSFKRPLFC
jgi:hypothetical protein